MVMKFLIAFSLLLLLPAVGQAADITGIPKIREGDQIVIGNTRIRLGGIDAPSTPRASAGPAASPRATN
jgi:endonuclease YncB( thermonuclease family)